MNKSGERQPDAVPEGRAETLVDGILILLTFTLIQRSVGFVRSVLFCRWLDPEQLGEWDVTFGFLMLAAPLSVLALSSSMRRYVEYYRQQGVLRRFLVRITAVYFLLGGGFVTGLLLARPWVSVLVYGSSDRVELVTPLALCLAATIAHYYFLDLFGSLRNARLLAHLQMANGLVFALVGVVLLWMWRCDAISVVVAFGVSCAVCALIGAAAMRRVWPGLSDHADPAKPLIVWSKILPFVGWVSLANFMGSMFDIADRYMIIHFSTYTASEALSQIGMYHSCRVVPLLLVSVVAMAASIITPHLAHDWEAGRRDRVDAGMQMLLKLSGFALTAACVCILYGAPLLFGVAFQGKFHGALEILPWTLAYCCWFAIFGLLQNYVWCCEKAYTATVALLAGLALNVCLNLLLLPRMGLLGAVLATASANVVALAILICFCGRFGLKLERSTWIAVALPACICLGPWLASLVLAAVAIEAASGTFLLNRQEKCGLVEEARLYLERTGATVCRLSGKRIRFGTSLPDAERE